MAPRIQLSDLLDAEATLIERDHRWALNLGLLTVATFLIFASVAGAVLFTPILAVAAVPAPLDWNIIVVAIISGFVTIVTSATAVIVGVMNNRKLGVLHSQINSRLDLLLEASGKVERAAGHAEGMADAKAEAAGVAAEAAGVAREVLQTAAVKAERLIKTAAGKDEK